MSDKRVLAMVKNAAAESDDGEMSDGCELDYVSGGHFCVKCLKLAINKDFFFSTTFMEQALLYNNLLMG